MKLEHLQLNLKMKILLRMLNQHLADYVVKSESEDLVNRVDFCYALKVTSATKGYLLFIVRSVNTGTGR